jgi:hypothetical protein
MISTVAFFAALGWDMDNAQGLAPQYRDVIHEDALRIGPHVKAPDCAFTLHGLTEVEIKLVEGA